MRRATHTLWVLYAALAVGLFGCALMSHQAHHWPGVAFFAAAAIGAALAIVHTSWLLDEHRHVLARLDARTRRQDDTVRDALNAACCEPWWASAGAEHDPVTCTRKDQTT
ncbi:hypothetical protein ACIQAC_01390 [Streptomyces sp. NPDC088387]|uniref:hypothetical protein n=1 Tax=Streptomyces sp. NPDC088387 TaxID=3365859 RepID=UPI00382512AD